MTGQPYLKTTKLCPSFSNTTFVQPACNRRRTLEPVCFDRYNLEVIEEQFGPIIRGIVEDRLLLERLPEPTSSESYLAIRQVYQVYPCSYLSCPNERNARSDRIPGLEEVLVLFTACISIGLRSKSNNDGELDRPPRS